MEIITHKLNSKVRGVIRRITQPINQTPDPEIIMPIDPENPLIPEEFPEPEETMMQINNPYLVVK
jgi:hypothetical protein